MEWRRGALPTSFDPDHVQFLKDLAVQLFYPVYVLYVCVFLLFLSGAQYLDCTGELLFSFLRFIPHSVGASNDKSTRSPLCASLGVGLGEEKGPAASTLRYSAQAGRAQVMDHCSVFFRGPVVTGCSAVRRMGRVGPWGGWVGHGDGMWGVAVGGEQSTWCLLNWFTGMDY